MVGDGAEELKTFSWLLNNHYSIIWRQCACLAAIIIPMYRCERCGSRSAAPSFSSRHSVTGWKWSKKWYLQWLMSTNKHLLHQPCSIACHFNLNLNMTFKLRLGTHCVRTVNRYLKQTKGNNYFWIQPTTKNYLYPLNCVEHFEIISVTNNGRIYDKKISNL